MNRLLSALREFVCFNQKQTIKYEFLISERHKELKNYFQGESVDKTELRRKFDKFIINSYIDLIEVFDANKDLIGNVFEILGAKNSPRITIKTIGGDSVLSIYRSTRSPDFSTSRISDNTGFSNILNKNEMSFISNDLEKLYIQGKYNNPRIKEDSIHLLKSGKSNWKDIWIGLDKDEKDSYVEYYSSTLIVPMSIRSDEIDQKEDDIFYSHFFDNVDQSKDSRTIWGFLCFDNKEKYYFSEGSVNEFLDAGYIFADILSLYLMYFYTHISGSKTIKKIEEYLESRDHSE